MSTRLQGFILETHIWLGISAVVCTWGTFVLLDQPVPVRYLLFVLSATIWVYTFHGYKNGKDCDTQSGPGTLSTRLKKIFIVVGFISSIVLFFMLDRIVQTLMLVPAFLAISYTLPWYNGRRLKDIPFVKIIAVVVSWTLVTYGIPIQKIDHWWSESGYGLLMLDRLFFFLALAIPFDIRDIEYDQNHDLATIPNTIGVENSQFLALFSVFLAAGFMALGFDHLDLPDSIRLGVLSVYILIGIVVIHLKHHPPKIYYSWLIDGFLLLYGLSILLLTDNL